nr:RNA-directed DNA polymerase, eukaryota [Tanacetum cinerariifolium]
MHLHANVVRFERTPSQVPRPSQPVRKATHTGNTFASVVKGNLVSPMSSSPALVLDDTCLEDRDYENCVMEEILQFLSISNLHILLFHEGFLSVRTVYLGGLWVMIELNSPETKNKLMNHVGVASWFKSLHNVQAEFVAKERIVWIDIEGVPLHAQSRAMFAKIRSKCGEMMDLEDGSDDLFAQLFVWSPMFKKIPEVEHSSDDVSTKEESDNVVEGSGLRNDDEDSDTEAVSDTYFDDNVVNVDNAEVQGPEKDFGNPTVNVEVSSDPFNIYGLLNNCKKDNVTTGSNTTHPFPLGFTPEVRQQGHYDNGNPNVDNVVDTNASPCKSVGSNTRIAKEAGNVDGNLYTDNRSCGFKLKEGGSILDILDEMIKVGQTMGLGSKAKKDWIRELNIKHKVSFLTLQETKMADISSFEVKLLWGNYCFDQIFSEALGSSGGILCVWGSNIFLKEQHIISDNFVALYGTWIPNKMKILLISVYAPQSLSVKRLLWNYLSSLITRWNGECLVMGDFNEVRRMEERWGSVFNARGADVFNSFISGSGLTECHFPHISAISLDRHLSDHRPILLREVIVDYGATPFRFYHSWLGLLGFDQMVMSTWNSIVLDDSNKMIRFKKKLQILKKEIRAWIAIYNRNQKGHIEEIKSKLKNIDKMVDQGMVTNDILLSIMDLMKQLHDVQSSNNRDVVQKAKVRWAIEGDENSKYFHAIINRKRAHLSVKGVLVDGDWVDDPIWEFAKGCNSSFVALIPKVLDPKVVSDYRPISLIGSLYKVITKILATRISLVMSDLISDVQTAFLPNTQILDGPFIVNEILSRCKAKNHQQYPDDEGAAEVHQRKFGNGESIRFWLDKWIGNYKLCVWFPRLFKFKRNKEVFVSDTGCWDHIRWNWCWDWVGNPRGRSMGELEDCVSLVRDQVPTRDGTRMWQWLLEDGILQSRDLKRRNLLDNLVMGLHSTLCPHCEEATETINHSMVRYKFVSLVGQVFALGGI